MPSRVEIAKLSQAGVAVRSHDDVVQNLDFEQLARSDQVASDLNIGFARGGIPAGMIMLWDYSRYVLLVDVDRGERAGLLSLDGLVLHISRALIARKGGLDSAATKHHVSCFSE